MKKVLVVDDEPVLRDTLCRMLEGEGVEAVSAGDTLTAMKECVTERPDLLLLDVNLPDGNGIQFCRRLKQMDEFRDIMVVILTGKAVSVDDTVDGLDSGADDYVLKPFSPSELMTRVSALLKRLPRAFGTSTGTATA